MNRYFCFLHVYGAVFCLVLSLAASAQTPVDIHQLSTQDYGFQVVNGYLPAPAPLGYESVVVSKLNRALEPGRSYELSFTLSAKGIRSTPYTLHPVIIASPRLALPYTDIWPGVEELETLHEASAMRVSPTQPTTEQTFRWRIHPVSRYEFVTVVIEDKDLQQVRGQARADLQVSGMFVSVLPLAPKQAPLEALPVPELATFSSRLPPKLTLPGLPPGPTSEIAADVAVLEQLTLASTKPPRTIIRHAKEIKLPAETIRIGLYDHKKVDGDIVTIFIDDRILVDSYTLSAEVKYFEFPLLPGEHAITLHAENLGEIEPNTAAVIFEAGEVREEVVLRSDLQRSEYLLLRGEIKAD